MAKMIKCPTCGTQMEVPPQAAGQIVKCPGCGKGLKLVAKPKPGGGGGGGPGQGGHVGAGTGGHPGGSVSGSSVSAMTFIGDPPPMERPGPAFDDLPSLDSNCAVCGRATDPEDLVEDNGRLVCPDCIKGARSAIARPEGGADLIEFKASSAAVRRGKLINFTPSFFVGLLAALVLIGCQVYLTLFEKPVGTALAHTTTTGTHGARPGSVDPATGFPATVPADGTAAPPTTGSTAGPATPPGTPDDTTAAPTPPADGTAATPTTPTPPADGTNPAATPGTAAGPASNPAVAMAGPEANTIFTDGPGNAGAGAGGAAPAPGDAGAGGAGAGAAPVDVPAPAPSVVSSDPLARGLERLTAHDFVKAAVDLDSARLKYVINKLGPPGTPLTPQQQLTLEGLAAAYIGQGRVDSARGPLESAYARNVRTRSLTLNTAIYMLSGQRPVNAMGQAAEMVRQYMTMQQNDEYAADIFGTLVNKISTMERAPKDQVAAWLTFHDNYIDQIAARGGNGVPEGKLKWGVDWLPAEDVKMYRQARGITNPGAGVGAAAKEVELAAQRVRSAEITLKNANAARANGGSADVQGAQSQLDAANAGLVKAQKALNDANAAMNVKKARWLTKFEPVIPQQIVVP